LGFMDYLEKLLQNIPNKNEILINISERYSGNREYIKDIKSKITKQLIIDIYKERYKDRYKRGTISHLLISKEISKYLLSKNIFMSDEAVRKVLRNDCR